MENNKLLNITTNEEGKEIPVIDSREVAEMMGKTHAEIIQYLEGLKDKNGKTKVVGIIPTLEQVGDLQVANYFVESTYNDRGRIKKCYLCTKMGCEVLGNKQQGEKGILFTAKYVERFNQMEEELKSKTQLEIPTSYVKAIEEQQSQIKDLVNMVTAVSDDVRRIEECVGIRSKTVFDYTKYIKTSLGIKRVNDAYDKVKQRIFHEFNVTAWEQLTYNDEVMCRIDEICRKYNPRKQKSLFDYFK